MLHDLGDRVDAFKVVRAAVDVHEFLEQCIGGLLVCIDVGHHGFLVGTRRLEWTCASRTEAERSSQYGEGNRRILISRGAYQPAPDLVKSSGLSARESDILGDEQRARFVSEEPGGRHSSGGAGKHATIHVRPLQIQVAIRMNLSPVQLFFEVTAEKLDTNWPTRMLPQCGHLTSALSMSEM